MAMHTKKKDVTDDNMSSLCKLNVKGCLIRKSAVDGRMYLCTAHKAAVKSFNGMNSPFEQQNDL